MTTILVVEDEKLLCDAYKKFLEKKDFKVDLSHDGEEALKYLDENKPDLILLDINMPKIDGVEFLERTRKIKRINKIPILLITGIVQTEKIGRCLELGAAGYIEKANSPSDVINKINSILGALTRMPLQKN